MSKSRKWPDKYSNTLAMQWRLSVDERLEWIKHEYDVEQKEAAGKKEAGQ